METLEEIKQSLDFTCKHEARPPLSEETQQLYQHALYLDLNHLWENEAKDGFWDKLLPYYRIAAANGDYKANVRLQYLLQAGYTQIDDAKAEAEVHQLNQSLYQQLPATSYYLLKGYIEEGYGVSAPPDSHYAFLRKAADMGSREAQYVLGNMIAAIEDEPSLQFRLELMYKLLFCASEQGLGDASKDLGISLQLDERYEEAVKVFYQGIKNGDDSSASWLSGAFKTPSGGFYSLNLPLDAERARRYELIGRYLFHYSYLEPKVPDLDDIAPLPPAPLPKWDGKIAFQRWVEGNTPPKPSDELMQKLAQKAGLDVATGLPLPEQPKAKPAAVSPSSNVASATTATAPPQENLWQKIKRMF